MKESKNSCFSFNRKINKDNKIMRPFWIIVSKEISDQIKSWRFIIMVGIILLTCFGSLYTALSNIGDVISKVKNADDPFLFLKLFTVSDGTMPSFFVFVSFLGPLLGISLGFDAINSEFNRGTMSRILSQPIHRDNLINAKFMASLIVISVLFFVMGFLVMGIGLIVIGIPPTAEEFMRIFFFLLLSIFYVAFWLNLSILFSVCCRQAATSALSGVAVWLFFSIFFDMIIKIIASAMSPAYMHGRLLYREQNFIMHLMRLSPNHLFSDATTTLLMPSVRSLGPLTMEQVSGAIPSPLPLSQSILLVWPQVTCLIAATVICFSLSYFLFMRKEVRAK